MPLFGGLHRQGRVYSNFDLSFGARHQACKLHTDSRLIYHILATSFDEDSDEMGRRTVERLQGRR